MRTMRRMAILLAGVFLTAAAMGAEIQRTAPVAMTLDMLVAKQFGGGWMSKSVNDKGATATESLILKDDQTYENYLSMEAPGVPSISANGRVVWFARVAADGTIEIALTTDRTEKNPKWVLHPLAIGTMLDDDKTWHR